MDETTGTPPEQQPVAPPPTEQQPPAAPPPPATAGDRPGPVSDTSKLLAALGYPIGVVAIVAILIEPYKDEKFVKFHAYQGIALLVVWVVAMIIPFVGWVLDIVVFIVMIIGLIKAFQGQYWEIPLIYSAVKGFIGEGDK